MNISGHAMFPLSIPARSLPKLSRRRFTKHLCFINICLFFYLIYTCGFQSRYGNYDNRLHGTQTSLFRYYSLMTESVNVFEFMEKMKRGGGGDRSNKIIEAEKIQRMWCNFLWSYPIEKPDVGVISNRFWQKIDDKHEIYLFNAYFDRRFDQRMTDATSFVRILGVVWTKLNSDVYCHVWFGDDDKPVMVKAIGRLIWLEHWDPRSTFYNAYLFTCPLAADSLIGGKGVPIYASLTHEKCATKLNNLLKIHDGQLRKNNQKKQTVVCVKGLDFLNDISLQLIEWFEANYIFGADKIVVYSYYVHPNVQKVLSFYENNRFNNRTDGGPKFEAFSISLPGRMPDDNFLARNSFIRRNRQQKRRDELIPYNDCIYRHIDSHEFALIIDIDELAVPQEPLRNWSQVLEESSRAYGVNLSNTTALSLFNAYFMDNFTDSKNSKWKFSANVRRSVHLSPKGHSSKSFVRLENVLTVFNHYPLHILRHKETLLRTEMIPPSLALKHHYRKDCPLEVTPEECSDYFNRTIDDPSLTAFDVVKNCQYVLKKMQVM